MKFAEYIIQKFSKPVSALSDRPVMSAQELKQWFDGNSTVEIKNSVNGIASLLDSPMGAQNIGCGSYKQFGENVESFMREAADRVIAAQNDVSYVRGMINQLTESSAKAQQAALDAMMYAKKASDIASDMNWLVLIDPVSGTEMGIQEILYNLYYSGSAADEITCDIWDEADWQCSDFDLVDFTCRQFDLENIFKK